MINANCPLCHSDNNNILFDLSHPTAHKDLGLPGIVKKCLNCGLLYKSFEHKVEDLYADKYASSSIDLKEDHKGNISHFFQSILESAFKRLRTPAGTLLDVGSGTSLMLQAAINLGYDATGVELSERLAENAKKQGYKVINTNISSISTAEKFDTITMMDIIEHLENPLVVLNAIKNLLSNRGEVIVYTPNHDSLIVKISYWLYKVGVKSPIENIFACTHTCFFTTKTLNMTLEQAGYKVIESKHFNYDVYRPGQRVTLVAKLAINMIEKIGSIFGLNGFRVVMYAQRLK